MKIMDEYKKNKLNRIQILLFAVLIIISLCAFIAYVIFAGYSEERTSTVSDIEGHFAFIADDLSDEFLDNVYNAACDEARLNNIYVERVGENLSGHYSVTEKMEMAISSNPLGIIVQADDSAEMKLLINEAVEKGIPVVTIMNDSPSSDRQSFVGPNYYDLGKQYGSILSRIAQSSSCNVSVLVKNNISDTNINNIYQGILEAVSFDDRIYHISIKSIDDTSAFDIEESVRGIILNETDNIDIIITLDLTTTNYTYQSLIDYNHVGDVKFIGYYNSQNVLMGIKNGILEAAVTLNAAEIGRNCVNALTEYQNYAYVSTYIPISIETIDSENVDTYLDDLNNEQD